MKSLSRIVYDRVVDKVAGPGMLNRPFSARRENLTVAGHVKLAAETDSRISMFTASYSWENYSIPTLAAKNAALKCLAAGKKPTDISFSLIFPGRFNEHMMKKYVAETYTSASFMHMQLNDVQVSTARVDKPIAVATVCGQDAGKAKAYEDNTYSIVSVGYPGDAGTIFLRDEYREKLSEKYPEHFLLDELLRKKNEEELPELCDVIKYAVAYGEGGIFAGLDYLSEKLHLGFDVDIKAIKLNQLTIEMCEEMDISPYNLMTSLGLLIVTDEPEAAVAVCTESGVPAQVIGVLKKSNDKIIQNSYENRYLDKFKRDSITEVNYES